MALKDLIEFADETDPAYSDVNLALRASELRQEHGHWGEHPEHSVDDWCHEAGNNDTRLGYWEWVANKLDSDSTKPEDND